MCYGKLVQDQEWAQVATMEISDFLASFQTCAIL